MYFMILCYICIVRRFKTVFSNLKRIVSRSRRSAVSDSSSSSSISIVQSTYEDLVESLVCDLSTKNHQDHIIFGTEIDSKAFDFDVEIFNPPLDYFSDESSEDTDYESVHRSISDILVHEKIGGNLILSDLDVIDTDRRLDDVNKYERIEDDYSIHLLQELRRDMGAIAEGDYLDSPYMKEKLLEIERQRIEDRHARLCAEFLNSLFSVMFASMHSKRKRYFFRWLQITVSTRAMSPYREEVERCHTNPQNFIAHKGRRTKSLSFSSAKKFLDSPLHESFQVSSPALEGEKNFYDVNINLVSVGEHISEISSLLRSISCDNDAGLCSESPVIGAFDGKIFISSSSAAIEPAPAPVTPTPSIPLTLGEVTLSISNTDFLDSPYFRQRALDESRTKFDELNSSIDDLERSVDIIVAERDDNDIVTASEPYYFFDDRDGKSGYLANYMGKVHDSFAELSQQVPT